MTDNIYGTPIRCQELYLFICFNTCNVCSNSRLVNSILRFRERSRDLDRYPNIVPTVTWLDFLMILNTDT